MNRKPVVYKKTFLFEIFKKIHDFFWILNLFYLYLEIYACQKYFKHVKKHENITINKLINLKKYILVDL